MHEKVGALNFLQFILFYWSYLFNNDVLRYVTAEGFFNAYSNARDSLDGPADLDQGIPFKYI